MNSPEHTVTISIPKEEGFTLFPPPFPGIDALRKKLALQKFWKERPVSAHSLRKNLVRYGLPIVLTGAAIFGGVKGYEALTTDKPPIGQNLERFDSKSLDTYIEPSNSLQMTLDEAIEAAPPLWKEEEKTLTIISPFIFRDNRAPTLHITKAPFLSDRAKLNNAITIDGLEEGDIIVSQIDGTITTTTKHLNAFFLDGKDSEGRDIHVIFATTGLNPLINFNLPSNGEPSSIPIKKGDHIGSLLASKRHNMYAGQIQIYGIASFMEHFNLASTSDEQAILLKNSPQETSNQTSIK